MPMMKPPMMEIKEDITLSMGSVSESYWWGAEVSYEQQSGDAVVVQLSGEAARLEHVFAELADWNREMLPKPGEVHETQVHSFHVLLTAKCQNFFRCHIWFPFHATLITALNWLSAQRSRHAAVYRRCNAILAGKVYLLVVKCQLEVVA